MLLRFLLSLARLGKTGQASCNEAWPVLPYVSLAMVLLTARPGFTARPYRTVIYIIYVLLKERTYVFYIIYVYVIYYSLKPGLRGVFPLRIINIKNNKQCVR